MATMTRAIPFNPRETRSTSGSRAWLLSLAAATQLRWHKMNNHVFADYDSPGDVVGHQLGGHEFDGLIVQSAFTWLRLHGQPLSDDAKP